MFSRRGEGKKKGKAKGEYAGGERRRGLQDDPHKQEKKIEER